MNYMRTPDGMVRLVCYDCKTITELGRRPRVPALLIACSCGRKPLGLLPVSNITDEQLRGVLNYIGAQAQRSDSWVPACGGTETPFVRHGVRYLWCYNHATGQSRYLNLDTDMITDYAEGR